MRHRMLRMIDIPLTASPLQEWQGCQLEGNEILDEHSNF